MGTVKLFRDEMKVFLAQNLFRFEEIELNELQTKNLLSTKISDNLNLDYVDTLVVTNVIKTLDYLETQDLKKISIDHNLFIKLNSLLAENQALEVGKYRDKICYIGCVSEPIEPAPKDLISENLYKLEHLVSDSFKKVTASVFCSLARAQPFFDGNKRSALFLCNVALMKKNLGFFTISNDQYKVFEDLLKNYYVKNDLSVVDFLSKNCFHNENINKFKLRR